MKIPKSFVRRLNRFGGKIAMTVSKHLPEILIATGIVTGGATVVVACVETSKMDPILEEAKDKVELVHQTVAESEDRELAVQNSKKDLTKIYMTTGFKMIKHYAPSIALGTLSVACTLTGHNILRRRNLAAAMLLGSTLSQFEEYRDRVRNELGEEKESDLYYNTKTTTVIDSENGEVTTIREANQPIDNYEIVFGPNCRHWDRDPNYNRLTISNVEQYGNDLLNARGYVFLNELLYEIGLPPVEWGQICGWKRDSDDGDNYVNLRSREVDTVDENGKSVTAFILNPNIDGCILYNFTKGLTA